MDKSKKFNLAELVNNEIKLALVNNTLQNKRHYYNILAKIMYTYDIEVENADKSMRSNIIDKSKNNNIKLNRLNFKNDYSQTVAKNKNTQPENCFDNRHSSTPQRCKSRSRSRSSRNNQNSANVNQRVVHVDENGSDDEVPTNSYDNSNQCCCVIM